MDEANFETHTDLKARIGNLENYRDDIRRWSEMLTITGQVENFSRKNWLSCGCEEQLSQNLSAFQSVQDANNQALQQALISFVEQQSDCCRFGKYLPNSSEVLE